MNILLRQAQPSDAPAIQAIYAPFVQDTAVSFELVPPTVEEIAARIAHIQATHAWIVIECQGKLAGYAYGSAHRTREAYRWATEVSVYLDPDFQGKGLGKTLYESLFEILRRMGYRRALAGIALPNARSIALHAHLGFVHIGVFPRIGFKFAQWWDTCWMELELGEGDEAPKAIRRPSELRAEEWEKAWQAGLDLLA
jgi:phosphinothricin acetyltransferase